MDNGCKDYKLEIQALADGEIISDGEKTAGLFLHLSTCKSCRDEYYETVKLAKTLGVSNLEQPTEEWFMELERKRGSSIVRKIGYLLLLVPYIIMIGFSIYEMLQEGGTESILLTGSFIAMIAGVLLLLGYSIRARVKESKTDKYKEIIR